MRDAAPGLIAKIGTYKPLVVCFVGKIIWSHVEMYLRRVSKPKGKRPRKQPFSYDLQPYKLVYSEGVLEGSSAKSLIPATATNREADRIDSGNVVLRRPEHVFQGHWV